MESAHQQRLLASVNPEDYRYATPSHMQLCQQVFQLQMLYASQSPLPFGPAFPVMGGFTPSVQPFAGGFFQHQAGPNCNQYALQLPQQQQQGPSQQQSQSVAAGAGCVKSKQRQSKGTNGKVAPSADQPPNTNSVQGCGAIATEIAKTHSSAECFLTELPVSINASSDADNAGSPPDSGFNNAAVSAGGSFSSQPTDIAHLPGMDDLDAFVLDGLDVLMPMDMPGFDACEDAGIAVNADLAALAPVSFPAAAPPPPPEKLASGDLNNLRPEGSNASQAVYVAGGGKGLSCADGSLSRLHRVASGGVTKTTASTGQVACRDKNGRFISQKAKAQAARHAKHAASAASEPSSVHTHRGYAPSPASANAHATASGSASESMHASVGGGMASDSLMDDMVDVLGGDSDDEVDVDDALLFTDGLDACWGDLLPHLHDALDIENPFSPNISVC